MKRFEFRLQTVLRLRERREEASRLRWAQAMRAFEEKHRQVQEVEGWIERSFRDARDLLRGGADAVWVLHAQAYRQSLDRVRLERLRQREERSRLAERERAAWLRASRDVRVLTSLRDRQQIAHRRAQARRLQAELDDLATARFGRSAGRIGTILLALPGMAILAAVTVGAFLWSRGDLDADRVRDSIAVLRGRQRVAAEGPPPIPDGTPAAEVRVLQEMRASREAREAMEADRDARHAARAALLATREAELARDLAAVQARIGEIEALQRRYDAGRGEDRRRAEAIAEERERMFETTVQILSTMKPDVIQDLLAREPDDVAARYLQAMDDRLAGRVLAAFQADPDPVQRGRAQRLLERIRTEPPTGDGGPATAGTNGNRGGEGEEGS